jgi:hypothetical protein
MALGRTPLPMAHDRLLAQDAEWWAQPADEMPTRGYCLRRQRS